GRVWPWLSPEKGQSPSLDELEVISEMPICLVMLDGEGEIYRIFVSNVDDDMVRETIYTSKMIETNYAPPTKYVGNLYTDQFSWSYVSNRAIVVVSCETLQSHLWSGLTWLIVFGALFEVLLFFICRRAADSMIAPIQRTFEKQKQFVADASHELKTPVAVILANAEAMEQDHDEH
ncbi:sensor histidine kinase, partial [gut metagenome]